MDISNEHSCETGCFSCCHNTHRFLQSEVLRLYFPVLEPWVPQSVSLPICSSWFIHTQMWDRWSTSHHLAWPSSSSCHLAPSPLHPGCPSPKLLLIQMNVFTLTPWLSDFHTVWFSGSSGYFFVFKFVVVLLLVVWGGKMCLLTPPSWPDFICILRQGL